MTLFQIHLSFSSTSPRFRLHSVLALVLIIAAGLAASPQTSPAQTGMEDINFCSIFQESPRTEGARSVVYDNWNANNESWESQNRIIQTFTGDTLTELDIQERAESGAWRDTARATPTYDSSNRLDLCTVETKEDGNFVNALRIDPTYNSNDLTEERLIQAWDTTEANPNGEWVNFLRSTFEYDNSDNDTLEVVESFVPDLGGWINSQRFHRTYDSQNRITLERQENWSFPGGPWVNARRTTTTYSGNSTVAVDETWEGSTWVNETRRTTTLDGDDLPTETLTETWDGSQWVNVEQSTYTYTTHESTQKFETVVVEGWDTAAGDWVNDNRTRFSYTDVIPVELAHFEARRNGESRMRLTWQTASETNNSGFELQRQTDPANPFWTTVHFVEGAGTTSEPQFYQFTDRALPYQTETVRYRLNQVDLDGTTHLSKTVEVRLEAPDRIALHAPFPNPSRSQATVRYQLPEATEIQIAVFDLLGRRVATPVDRRVDAGRAQFRLRTEQLPSGTYILRLRAADQTHTQRLTVVK